VCSAAVNNQQTVGFKLTCTICGNVFAEQNGPHTRLMAHVKTEKHNTSYTLHRISGIFQVINNDMNLSSSYKKLK
jgi:hypothetical protein